VGAPINIWEYDYEGHVEYNALISGLIANSTKTLSRRLTGREQSIPRFHVLEWHKSGLLHPHILLIVKRKPATDLDLYTDKDGNRRSKMVEAVFTHTSKNSPFRPGHKVKWGTSIMALAIQAPKDANRIAGYMASLLRYTTKDLLLDQGTTIDIATGLRAQHFAYLDCFAEHIGKADTHDTPSKDEIMASYTRKIMDRKYRGKRAFGFNGQMFASSKTWSPLTLAACHVHAIRQARAAGITQAPKDTRSLEEAIIKIDHRIRGLQEIRHHGHLF
jgi:hypothetical protein